MLYINGILQFTFYRGYILVAGLEVGNARVPIDRIIRSALKLDRNDQKFLKILILIRLYQSINMWGKFAHIKMINCQHIKY